MGCLLCPTNLSARARKFPPLQKSGFLETDVLPCFQFLYMYVCLWVLGFAFCWNALLKKDVILCYLPPMQKRKYKSSLAFFRSFCKRPSWHWLPLSQ